MTAPYDTPAAAARAHEELHACWQSLRREGRLPSREDIDPAAFKRHLPGVSLIDVIHGGARFRYRLAGTALHGVYGRELTGQSIEGAFGLNAGEYWTAELQKAVATGRPSAGVHSLAWRGRPHLSVLWLRLPLARDGRRVDMLMGFDALVGAGVGSPAAPRQEPSGIRAA